MKAYDISFLVAEEVQALLNQHGNLAKVCRIIDINPNALRRFIKINNIQFKKIPLKHSEEAKLRLSLIRKTFLKENPDKHPWRSHEQFKSHPCEKLKEFLRSKQIEFIEEFRPKVSDRHYSIDIAFPDRLIAVEVNGNQHYEKDGRLTPYYLERQTLLEQSGWTVYQLHYSICYNPEKLYPLFTAILENPAKIDFDFLLYRSKQCNNLQCVCGKTKSRLAKVCRACSAKAGRPEKCKITWPAPDTLRKLVWETPLLHIAKTLKVSDVALSKRCKRLGIEVPKRGYWAKREAGMSHEQALLKKEKGTEPRKKFSESDLLSTIRMIDEGKSVRFISRELGFARRTILRHLKSLNETGH